MYHLFENKLQITILKKYVGIIMMIFKYYMPSGTMIVLQSTNE